MVTTPCVLAVGLSALNSQTVSLTHLKMSPSQFLLKINATLQEAQFATRIWNMRRKFGGEQPKIS